MPGGISQPCRTAIVRSVDDALNSPLPDYRASGVLRVAASYTVLGSTSCRTT